MFTYRERASDRTRHRSTFVGRFLRNQQTANVDNSGVGDDRAELLSCTRRSFSDPLGSGEKSCEFIYRGCVWSLAFSCGI